MMITKLLLLELAEKQKKSLPKNIIGITRTNNIRELVEIYSAADVFVNPTLEDNFPTTNLEALACGLPIITFNTGGSPEVVEDCCGKVINRISKEIEDEIILMNQEKMYVNKECRNKAEKDYNKIKNFNKYIEIYLQKNGSE